jgi:hypothetical protein
MPRAMPTIVYRDPRRPQKMAMTLISDQEGAAATVERLEKLGFVVDKIRFVPPAPTRPPIANAAD